MRDGHRKTRRNRRVEWQFLQFLFLLSRHFIFYHPSLLQASQPPTKRLTSTPRDCVLNFMMNSNAFFLAFPSFSQCGPTCAYCHLARIKALHWEDGVFGDSEISNICQWVDKEAGASGCTPQITSHVTIGVRKVKPLTTTNHYHKISMNFHKENQGKVIYVSYACLFPLMKFWLVLFSC